MPGAGGQTPQRTTFRPPWVKDGPNPLPMPTAPWAANSRRDSKPQVEEAPAFTKVTLKKTQKPAEAAASAESTGPKKQSKITIIPSQAKNDSKQQTGQPSTRSKVKENGRPEPSRPQLERQVRVEKSRSRGDVLPNLSKSESTTGAPTLSKSSSRAAIPPPPPPRPPPPPSSRIVLKDLTPLTEKQEKTLEMLKNRPRKRPDWAQMMKEVESGRKLRHVKCNDRSAPLIERVNKVHAETEGTSHFIFESEKSNMHNQLLHQIQQGVKLKSVKTNDRSKPILEGLRKFRRQMTIEEQIQKAESSANIQEIIPDDDELDDIDAVRDDLQSTKQMLALELRNKEAVERENKRLQARLLNLEAELEREKARKNVQEHKQQDAQFAQSLREDVERATKESERLEKECSKMANERDKAQNELEDMKKMYAALERRMKAEELWPKSEPIMIERSQNIEEARSKFTGMALAGCPSGKDVARIASQKSIDKSAKAIESESEEEETEEEESSEEDEDEDPKVAEERRLQRELKLLQTKITTFDHKEVNAKKERHALKEQIKQQQKLLKEENKKFKRLQKEVDKMAKLMADTDDDDEKVEEEEEEVEEEEEEDSESEESESEESSSEEDSDTENKSVPLDKRKNHFQNQVKRREARVSSLKKGNYLLKAQVDRLKDDLMKQREKSLALQEDLDSVLAELG